MSQRWFLCPVIGTGEKENAYRSQLSDLGVTHVAHIPSHPNGSPLFTWCLCLASASDFTAVDAQTQIRGFPGLALTDTVGSFSVSVQNTIQTALTNRGVDLTGITLASTIGELVHRAGQTLGLGWTVKGTTLT